MQSSNGESFEWLLLKANLFRDSSIKDILEKPEEYIDSKEFLSWEQFFTSLIIEVSKDTYLQYSKKKLNNNYLQENVKTNILKNIKNISFIK